MAKVTERTIGVDGLVAAMNQYANEFLKATNTDVEEVCNEVGKQVTDELKTISPKDTGKYARAWRYTLEKGGNWARAIVHEGQYQLVHLLEYGHAKVNGGRTMPQPHIEPEQEKADKLFIEKLRKRIEASK